MNEVNESQGGHGFKLAFPERPCTIYCKGQWLSKERLGANAQMLPSGLHLVNNTLATVYNWFKDSLFHFAKYLSTAYRTTAKTLL